jgi:hypothetical protein
MLGLVKLVDCKGADGPCKLWQVRKTDVSFGLGVAVLSFQSRNKYHYAQNSQLNLNS